jgi:integrase
MARKQTRRYGSGSIYTYKNGNQTRYRWQAYVLVNPDLGEEGFERKSKGGYITAKAADEAMQEALQNSRKRQVALPGKDTFESFASEWLKSQDVEMSTYLGYEKILRVHLLPHFGHLKLVDITSAKVSTLYKLLLKEGNKGRLTTGNPLSANTVNKIHIVLGSILKAAVEGHKIIFNPARVSSVKAPTGRTIRKQQEELKPWTRQHVSTFLNWSQNVDQDDLFPLWHIYCYTGMRRGEGVALMWEDINFETKMISVRRASDAGLRKAVKKPKNDTARAIEIGDETIAILKAHKAERAKLGLHYVKPNAFIFGTLDGTVRNPGDVGARWSTALQRAQSQGLELPHITLKGLRHTHATILLEAKVPTKVIQERLGHSNYSTTMNIYSHVTQTMQSEAVEVFSKRVGNL